MRQDILYALSFPRSGSTWFRYCFEFITKRKSADPAGVDFLNDDGTRDKRAWKKRLYDGDRLRARVEVLRWEDKTASKFPQLLFHSHDADDYRYRSLFESRYITPDCDIKHILLLRNYKEAAFSQLINSFNDEAAGKYLIPVMSERKEKNIENFLLNRYPSFNGAAADPELHRALTDQYHGDVLSRVDCDVAAVWPIHRPNRLRSTSITQRRELTKALAELNQHRAHAAQVAAGLSTFIGYHQRFASNLKKYLQCVALHDKIYKNNKNNALLIRYEDLIQNPARELNRLIEFIDRTGIISTTPDAWPSTDISFYKNNLNELIENIAEHKRFTIKEYRRNGHVAASFSKSIDGVNSPPTADFYGKHYTKDFLIEIDEIMKKNNLELFNKYLACYEERL